MTAVPQDLIDYLVTMISPPEPHPKAVFWDGLDGNLVQVDEVGGETHYKDNVLTGLILRPKSKAEPTEAQSKELLRILRPGAHLLIIAPDDQPTGHTAVCTVEDIGFEVRDAICWANEAGDGDRLHYVAKAARSEREAGCYDLPSKTGAEATDREEDTAGLNNPRAGAGRTSNEVHNFHPTVKPIDLMVRLLSDVPKDEGPVIDPFMGSGTTAIACVKTGHDFVGIEREDDFIAIATTRAVYHKNQTYKGDKWDEVYVVSDWTPPTPDKKPKSKKAKAPSAIEDLFG